MKDVGLAPAQVKDCAKQSCAELVNAGIALNVLARTPPFYVTAGHNGGLIMQITQRASAVSIAALSVLGLVILAEPASAHVVCNRAGDCWSTHANVTYPSNLGIRKYSDRYANDDYRQQRWGSNGRTWRGNDHDRDRGAYRNGVWFSF